MWPPAGPGMAAAEPELEPGVLRSQWLGPQPEEEVLKSGLQGASEKLGEEGILEFPRRPNGTPVITRQGFFERMLRGESTLQNCAAADASAAEADVKRLGLKQLLRVRCLNMDFMPSGNQASKASFLNLVDRCTMSKFGERLLPDIAGGLNDAQRAYAMRHVVLIYGADRVLRQREAGDAVCTDWWQLKVGSVQRFLHLPSCRTEAAPPAGEHACCYRVYTAAAPRDPRKARVFRWQVLLVEQPGSWMEDPYAASTKPDKRGSTSEVLSPPRAEAKAKAAAVASAPAADSAGPAGEIKRDDGSAKAKPSDIASEDAAPEELDADAEFPPTPGSAYTLFGDLDVDGLFEGLDDDQDTDSNAVGATSSAHGGPGSTSAVRAAEGSPQSSAGEIDDFFDSLLSGAYEAKPASGSTSPPTETGASSTVDSDAADSAAALASALASKAAPMPSPGATAAAALSAAVESAAQASSAHAPPRSAVPESSVGAEVSATAGSSEKVASEATGGSAPPQEAEGPPPPKDAAEARLRAALAKFYQRREVAQKLGNVEKIASKYAGDGVVDLWVALSGKYSLPPPTAVYWLANTLDPRTAVQWPKGAVPAGAQQALNSAFTMPTEAVADSQAGEAAATPGDIATASLSAQIRAALEAGDPERLGALVFRHGCADLTLRPRVWRVLLNAANARMSDSSITEDAEDAEGLAARRVAYRELRERMLATPSSSIPTESDPAVALEGEEASEQVEEGAASPTAKSVDELRAEVQADAKSAWRGEAFVQKPGVMDAVVSVALTHAWRCSQFVRGSCEMAALLMYVMTCDGAMGLPEAEADSYWFLSQLMGEVQDSIMEDSSLARQAKRVHGLLRAYDPPIAELLAEHGLAPMPTMRLGVALFTRAGFKLEDCARLWDTMLADPMRFQLADYAIVALLLLSRGDIMQSSTLGGAAETVVAAAQNVDMQKLLRTTYAICAFERRCIEDGVATFPPRPRQSNADALDRSLEEAVSAAQTRLTGWWGKVRSAGAEAWTVGSKVATEKSAILAAEAPAWREQAQKSFTEAVSATKVSTEVAKEVAANAAWRASAAIEAFQTAKPEADLLPAGDCDDWWEEEDKRRAGQEVFVPPPREAGPQASPVASESPATAPGPQAEPPSAPPALIPAAAPGDGGQAPPALVPITAPEAEGPPALVPAASAAGEGAPPALVPVTSAEDAPPALVQAPSGGPPMLVQPPALVQAPSDGPPMLVPS